MLLGVVAVVLLLAVLFATFTALQFTRSAVLRDDQRLLSDATNILARRYSERAETDLLKHGPQLLENADSQSSQDSLAALSRTALQNVDGVEGGFYAADQGRLVGYFSKGSAEGAEPGTEEEIAALLGSCS